MPKDDKTPRVRITNQFHDNHGMVYDLKCDVTRITISLGATSKEETEWNIEAMVKQVAGAARRARGWLEPKRRAPGHLRDLELAGRGSRVSAARLGRDSRSLAPSRNRLACKLRKHVLIEIPTPRRSADIAGRNA